MIEHEIEAVYDPTKTWEIFCAYCIFHLCFPWCYRVIRLRVTLRVAEHDIFGKDCEWGS